MQCNAMHLHGLFAPLKSLCAFVGCGVCCVVARTVASRRRARLIMSDDEQVGVVDAANVVGDGDAANGVGDGDAANGVGDGDAANVVGDGDAANDELSAEEAFAAVDERDRLRKLTADLEQEKARLEKRYSDQKCSNGLLKAENNKLKAAAAEKHVSAARIVCWCFAV
jgi:hypothetical protein